MNLTWLYVGALYAAAVYIARRLRADFPWRIALLFYALVLIFIFRPLTGPYVNLPSDILLVYSPWSAIRSVHQQNSQLNDLTLQIVPWAHQVREAWRSGHVPLWNALSGSGYPLLATGQSAALSPLRLLALPLSLGNSFTAEAAMKMLIALSFMYGFCRRRWSELPSAIGAVCFGFCTFVQVWLHFPLGTAAVWIPAAIVSIDLLFERVSRRRIVATAAAWCAMLLGGHPETVAHTAFIASLFILWLLLVERPLPLGDAARRIGALAVAAVLAALVASPFLVPFAETIRKSKRYQELQERPNVVGYYSDWQSTIILMQPHFFGHVPEEQPWGPAAAESITAFAGVLGVGAWLALLLRAIAQRRFRDREMFFILLAPIVVGILLGWPGISTFFHLLFKFAANARLRLMLCWIVAALTAAIIDVALREGYRYLIIASLAAAALLGGFMAFVRFPSAPVRGDTLLSMAPSLIVIAATLLLMLPRRYAIGSTCVLFAAIVMELWSATRTWNPVARASTMYPSMPIIDFLRRQRGPFRIVGIEAMLFPNTQAVYGLEDIRAHDPMANGHYIGLLRAVGGYETETYHAMWRNTATPLLDYLNVKYVVAERQRRVDDPKYRLVYDGPDGRVYENRDVLPRFFPVRAIDLAFRPDVFVEHLAHHTAWADTAIVNTLPVFNARMHDEFLYPPSVNAPRATVTLTRATATDYSMRVSAPRYTLVVSSIPFWPAWRVEQDGNPILARPVNGAFLGFTVPPGRCNIRVYYQPAMFYVAAVISLLTIIGMAVMTIRD